MLHAAKVRGACRDRRPGFPRKALLRRLQQVGKQRWVCPYELGTTYLALGDKEQALRELENAYQAHSICMVWAKDDPRLDPLRSEPRFQAILQSMSFPQ